MTPQERLKAMLEATERMDTSNDPESPLIEADPHALDEFFARIDTELQLGNVPPPSKRDAIIQYHRDLRLKFLAEGEQIITKAPRKRTEKVAAQKGTFGPDTSEDDNDEL